LPDLAGFVLISGHLLKYAKMDFCRGKMKKIQNKFCIESNRCQHWDYGSNAAYFVTICTKNRKYFFGNMDGSRMIASETGKIARECWEMIAERFSGIKLDEFILMPNHIHGIIIIDKPKNDRDNAVGCGNPVDRRDAINRVSTGTGTGTGTESEPVVKPGGITGDRNPMLHENLSRIIRWYKGRVTFESRKINDHFAWQRNYHDHIARDEPELNRIRRYIRQNPKNWQSDRQNANLLRIVGGPIAVYEAEIWMI
jgi:REP element-mobilizing transposase RayT